MKLLQLNVWGGRLGDHLNDFLRDQSPDILCLQEAIAMEHSNGAPFTTVDVISKILGAQYNYVSPVYSFTFMQHTAHFGNAIMSRFPISHQETIFTADEYQADFDWTRHTRNIRNLQYVQIDLGGGQPLHLFNHHGHHNHIHKDGDDESVRQINLIVDKIKSVEGKKIVSGDFNLIPDAPALQPLNGLLRNLTKEAGLATTRTELTSKTEACDYIFTSPEIQVESFNASAEVVSDHQALILEFS